MFRSLLLIAVLASTAHCKTAGDDQSRALDEPDGAVGATTPSACPDTSAGETPADCPWAGVARDLQSAAAQQQSLDPVLDDEAAVLAANIRADSAHPAWLDLWGAAIDFEKAAPGVIVAPAIVDLLNQRMGVVQRQSVTLGSDPAPSIITHAGVQHTYGYLFSTLRTPYGYKRARWVAGDVTAGFGLPPGTLGPSPTEGSLFANATYFAGMVAFAGEPEQATLAAELQADPTLVASSIRGFDFSTLQPRRLTETINVPSGGRTVTLRTDFVPLPSASGSDNALWLVYSVHDSADGRSRLITAFPVTQAAFEQSTSPAALGDQQRINTRYNAYVPGVTGASFLGRRVLQ